MKTTFYFLITYISIVNKVNNFLFLITYISIVNKKICESHNLDYHKIIIKLS